MVRARIQERGGSQKLLVFYLGWTGERFALQDATSEGESLAEFVGSGHRSLFERNRNDPARSLFQRGIIPSAADYRPDLGPGETRCG